MRIAVTAFFVGVAGLSVATVEPAQAERRAHPPQAASTDVSAQARIYRRRPPRIRIYPRLEQDDVYPRYDPGPHAVRDCTAHLVQEFRASGTVITPRVNCFWRPG
jgi:hypothetical protein